MSDLNKLDIQKLIAARLEELGLTRLSRMFSVEHSVPRGTHKRGAGTIASPTAGAVQDAEARAAINLIINALKAFGVIGG